MDTKKIIIFGAGYYGRCAYYKLNGLFHICFFIDNNISLCGTDIEGVKVISFEMLKMLDVSKYTVIIASKAYYAIATQLLSIGIKEYYVILEGFLYHTDMTENMMPHELIDKQIIKKSGIEKNILFVQNAPCIRTNKIAEMVKKAGYKVYLLYSLMSPEGNYPEYIKVYDRVYTFFTMDAFISFVNDSDIDIIHSSNEPDILTVLLQQSNKPIVYDCHDLSSDYLDMSVEALNLEFLANNFSDGMIYTTELFRDKVIKKYKLDKRRTFALENLISENMIPKTKKPKLSDKDGKIHCVYEGGVSNEKRNLRYFNDVWRRIASKGIYIHFYSTSNEIICKELEKVHQNIIYEGKMPTKKMIEDMTKYDVGLCIYNITDENRKIMEYASANKLQEYIAAGIPVAVSTVDALIDRVSNINAGGAVNLDGDIFNQFKNIKGIKIGTDVLKKNGLTMESQLEGLLEFYESVKQRAQLSGERYGKSISI